MTVRNICNELTYPWNEFKKAWISPSNATVILNKWLPCTSGTDKPAQVVGQISRSPSKNNFKVFNHSF